MITSITKKEDSVLVTAEQIHWLQPDLVEEPEVVYGGLQGFDLPAGADIETSWILLGDVNLDGAVDILDIVAMINIIINNTEPDDIEVVGDPYGE